MTTSLTTRVFELIEALGHLCVCVRACICLYFRLFVHLRVLTEQLRGRERIFADGTVGRNFSCKPMRAPAFCSSSASTCESRHVCGHIQGHLASVA